MFNAHPSSSIFDSRLMTRTSAIIRTIPMMAGMSGICLNGIAPIIVIKTMPITAQTVYAILMGIVLNDRLKE